ncbi:MAG: tetratricopeptide repeat protein [Prevotellaceae bacterium]|jgi:tetratricopeptide (TPR) repeat protein|nr:tetratricopeptide repeat protein [Prevotellaceae bacterium]
MRNRNLLSSQERELQDLIDRYEQGRQEGKSIYLDSDDIAAMADWYTSRRKPEESLELVKYGLTLHPESIALKVVLAYTYSDLDKPGKAKKIAESLPEDSEDVYEYADIMSLKAYLAFDDGDDDKALSIIRKVLRLTLDEGMFTYIVYLLMDFGHMKLAGELLDDENNLRLYRNSFVFKTLKGEYYYLSGQLEKAAKVLNEQLDIEPYSAYLWYTLARCYLDMGEHEKALDACNYALVSDDEFGEVYMIKASCYAYLGNIAESVANCKLAEKYDPGIKNYYQFMAVACAGDEQWDAAYEFITQVDIFNLHDIPSMYENGTVEYQRKIIYDLLVTLGSVYYRTAGRKKRGEECWKTAKKLAPEWPGINLAKGRLLYEDMESEKAARLWKKALKMSPTVETFDSVGTHYLELGLISQAILYLGEVQQFDPFYEGVNEKLALCYLLRGEYRMFSVYNQVSKNPISDVELDVMKSVIATRNPDAIFNMINDYLDKVYADDEDEEDIDDEDEEDNDFDGDFDDDDFGDDNPF